MTVVQRRRRLSSTLFILILLVGAINFSIIPIEAQTPSPAQAQENSPSTVGTVGYNKLKVLGVNDVVLYSDALAVRVVWDGVKRYDEILNHTVSQPWIVNPISYWCKWKVDWYKGTPPATPWVSLTESSVTFSNMVENSTGAYLTVNATMNDGSIFMVTYKLQGKLKWDLKFKASNAWTTKYRFTYEYFTLPCEKMTIETTKEVVFSYAPDFWIKFLYDDVDLINYPKVETWDSATHKFYFSIDLGTFTAWQTKEIDPSTVGTSTTENAIRFGHQRKSFHAQGLFWAFYSDGTDMVYKTSSNGVDWVGPTVARSGVPNGLRFSIWLGTYVHYAYAPATVNQPIYYRRGTPNGDGSITWTDQVTAVPSQSNRIWDRPFISVDDGGYPWIVYRGQDEYGTNLGVAITKSSTNDGTWSTASGFPFTLKTGDYYWVGVVVPLTSQKVLAVYGGAGGEKVYVRAWNGGSWLTEQSSTYTISGYGCLSAVAEVDDGHIVYVNSGASNYLYYIKYTYSSNSLSAEETIQSDVSGATFPVLSIHGSTLYCFWIGTPTANHIYYKKRVSGVWDAVPTDWLTETGTNTERISGFYQSYSGKMGLLWTTGTSSPYNIRFDFLTLVSNQIPTNDDLTLDLTGASYKGTKTLLTSKQDYKFVHKCSDLDGVTDINYAEIRLDYATKNVILRATRGSGDTWTFSEQSDPSNYVTLNTGGSSHSTSGNQKTFNFLVTINWNWDDASETLGVRAYVIDSQSASDTDDYANIFGVENDLASSGLTVNDYRCNPSQTLTFSGYWYYEGTSIAPPDGNYAVVIKLAGVQKGSTDTTLVSGAFSIGDVTAEATVGSYSYTVEATYMASAGSFSAVIVEGLKVSAYSIDLANMKVYVRLLYAYDNSAVQNGNLSLAGLYVLTNSTGWATFDMASASDFSYSQVAYGVQDQAYGITYKHTNQTLPIAKKTRLIQSDATISTLDWDGTKLIVTFSGASGSYTLKVSGSRPTYLLNVTYNLANNYTTYLSLSHDASHKIVISYADWGDFYIRSTEHILQSIYWADQKLTLVLNGTSGETGILTVYAGSRANPESTSGFTGSSYNTNTKIFQGNYKFSSTLTLTLDWTKPPGTPSGPSIYFQVGHLNLDAAIGIRVPFVLNVEFNVHRITITRIEFGQNPEWFKVTDALPKDFSGTGPTTTAKINGEATIPTTASAGSLIIPITVYGLGPEGQQLQSGATITLNITQPPPGPTIPEIVTRMLGDPFILILLIAFAVWLGYYEFKRH